MEMVEIVRKRSRLRMMTTDLKPLPLSYSNDPLHLMRYRYKYTSADNQYYIYAFYYSAINGVSKVSWSLYRYGHDDIAEKENMIGLGKDFHNMLTQKNGLKKIMRQ
jgi:hypothetical protein